VTTVCFPRGALSPGERVQVREAVEDGGGAGGAGGRPHHAEQSRGVLPDQRGGTRRRPFLWVFFSRNVVSV